MHPGQAAARYGRVKPPDDVDTWLGPGRTLRGRYRLEELLGRGGAADVFRATDLTLHVPRVVKIGVRPTPAAASRAIHREYTFLSSNRRLGFPQAFESFTVGPCEVLVRELVEGVDLAQAPLPRSVTALLGVARRLVGLASAVHAAGHVHRDLKPENVLVPPMAADAWSIVDFGSVCPIGSAADVVGTPTFAAPEVLAARPTLPSADAFSVGRCLQSLATAWGVELPAPLSAVLAATTSVEAMARPSMDVVERLVVDLWAILASAADGHCLHCFGPRGGSAPSCPCAVPATDRRGVEAAAARVLSWCREKSDGPGAAWAVERAGAAVGAVDRADAAQRLLTDGQGAVALGLLERAPGFMRTGVPAEADATLQLELVARERGLPAAVDAVARWAPALGACSPWARNAARLLAAVDRRDEARALVRRALAARPNDGLTHGLLATFLEPGPERDRHLEEAALGEPPDPKAARQLCEQRMAAGDLRAAVALARRAADRHPTVRSLRDLAFDLAFADPEAWPRLEQDLRRAMDVAPDVDVLERLVKLYVRSDRVPLLADLPRDEELDSEAARAVRALADALGRGDPVSLAALDAQVLQHATARWLEPLHALFERHVRSSPDRVQRWLDALPPGLVQYRDELVPALLRSDRPAIERKRASTPARTTPRPAPTRPPARRTAPAAPGTSVPSPPAAAAPAPAPPPAASDQAAPSRIAGLLATSEVWARQEELISTHIDRVRLFRLLDALLRTSPLPAAEAARIAGVPPYRLSGMVAQVQSGLNVDGEDVLVFDSAANQLRLDRALLTQLFEIRL